METSSNNYKNMYWDQVRKRKLLEEQYSSRIHNNNNNDIKLLERINFLEQSYIFGNISSINNNFIIISTNIGDISIHKSKVDHTLFSYKHINKKCKFKLFYHINKYQGHDLILL